MTQFTNWCHFSKTLREIRPYCISFVNISVYHTVHIYPTNRQETAGAFRKPMADIDWTRLFTERFPSWRCFNLWNPSLLVMSTYHICSLFCTVIKYHVSATTMELVKEKHLMCSFDQPSKTVFFLLSELDLISCNCISRNVKHHMHKV